MILRQLLGGLLGGPPMVEVVGGVIETSGRGLGARIAIADLIEVGILTTAAGPQADDAFWMLRARGRLYSVPWSAEGGEKLLEALQALPGFDHEAVIAASASTEEAAFLAWRKDAPEAGVDAEADQEE